MCSSKQICFILIMQNWVLKHNFQESVSWLYGTTFKTNENEILLLSQSANWNILKAAGHRWETVMFSELKTMVDFPSLPSLGSSFLFFPQSWSMVLQNSVLLQGKKKPSKKERKKKWTFFRIYVAMLLKYILKYARKSEE